MSEKKDEERDGDTEPFQSDGSDPALKPEKRKRVGSRFFNAVLALAFFFIFVMSLISFSASSNSYRKISGTDSGGLGKACALNAEYETDSARTGSPGSDGACQFSIGGEVILTVYAGLSLAVMIIKIIGGWSMISCFLVFELISCFVMACLSFSVSVVVSVGLSLSCRRLKTDGFSCSQLTVYSEKFYTDLEVAQATAWLGFAIQAFVLVFYIICIVMYGYGRRQAKRARKETLEKMTGIRQEDDANKAI